MAKPALGRGLSALLGGKPPGGVPSVVAPDPIPASTAAASPQPVPALAAPEAATASGARGIETVAVGRVHSSSFQPRRDFPAETLRELADSIREQGILQPLVVRRQGEQFELIAGERRWRAAQLAGLTEVPVIVREADDTTALELMLVENLQREDLNPVEEAQGYAELMERFGLTQEGVAIKVGKSRAAVANALRLLKLPSRVQGLLREGRISTGHAKVLLGLTNPDLQAEASERVAKEGLSVRQAEEMVARLMAAPPIPVPGRPPGAVVIRDPHVVAVEDRLRQRLGTKVTVRYKQGRGQIDIRFFSDDELERILDIVGARPD